MRISDPVFFLSQKSVRMNKIKWALMIAAVVLGIGGAILTHSTAALKTAQPFYAANGCVSAPSNLPQTSPAVR